VVLHESLKVEVSELIGAIDLEERTELVIGVDLASVFRVLKLVGADIGIDLLANSRAGHLTTRLLSEKGCKLVTDKSGLNKTRGGSVARALLLLGRRLQGGLELAGDNLLESLEITLDGRENTVELLELSTKLIHLLSDRRSIRIDDDLVSKGGGGLNCRDSSINGRDSRLGRGLLGRSLLRHLCGGLSNRSRNGGSVGGGRLLYGLRCSYHSKYTLYIVLFLYGLTH